MVQIAMAAVMKICTILTQVCTAEDCIDFLDKLDSAPAVQVTAPTAFVLSWLLHFIIGLSVCGAAERWATISGSFIRRASEGASIGLVVAGSSGVGLLLLGITVTHWC